VFTLEKSKEKRDKEGMKIKESQYQQIEKLLPRQRGNVKINNRQLLAALI